MSDRHWKAEERRAAALFGGCRFPASSGGRLDFETGAVCGSVKHLARCSLAELERLAVEVEQIGMTRQPCKSGVVVVKRRAGRGQPTPRLVVVTEAAWLRLTSEPPLSGRRASA